MIYLTDSSMWWLILPSVFTALDNPQLHERLDKETVDEFGLDKDTRNKINKFLEQDRVNRKGNQ